MPALENSRILFTVIIVTHGRWNDLKRCLKEIFFQWRGREDAEILILLNGKDEETERHLNDYPSLKIFKTSFLSPAEARNILIRKARGSYLCCLDDDAVPAEHYFFKACDFIRRHPGVDVFGGPETVCHDASFFEKTVGMALSSPMATAVTRWRHRQESGGLARRGDETRLILCNLWFKREIFHKEGFGFDGRFFRNEENVLLWQLHTAGKIIESLPFLLVYHRKKKNISLLMKAVFRSARNRLKSFFLFPASLSFIYFLPMCFVFYLVSLLIVPPVFYRIPLVLYVLLSLFFSMREAWRRERFFYFPSVFFIQISMNMGYGIAFWVELFSLGNRQRPFVREERKKEAVLSCQYNEY